MSSAKRILVYDLNLKRPACAILQVALGGSVHVALMFPSECWLVAPTPDLKAYSISEEELKKVVEMHGGIYREPV